MKNKKAIKELKREIAYLNDAHNAIHSFTAYQSQDIDEFKRQNETNKELIGILNEKLNSVILRADNVGELKSQIEELEKRVSNINIQGENDIIREMLKEQINKLQFLVNSKNGSIDALSNKLGNLKSDLQTIAKHVQNLEAEKCSCHTNTQKTNKNATEGKQEGKKEYSKTIVTNEMFNEELEKRLSESFIQDHPAFMLLNGFIPSNTIEDLIRAKLKSKGEHYSPNGDRYSNFKRLNNSTASFKQKTVKERIENFMEKHEIWIEDYQAGDVNGTLLDLIESCIDVLDYYLLLDIYLKFNPEVKNG